jgi:hypothetical protein
MAGNDQLIKTAFERSSPLRQPNAEYPLQFRSVEPRIRRPPGAR